MDLFLIVGVFMDDMFGDLLGYSVIILLLILVFTFRRLVKDLFFVVLRSSAMSCLSFKPVFSSAYSKFIVQYISWNV